MEIEVIQYLLPDGRKNKSTTNISDEYKEQYDDMMLHGYNLAAEILRTGEVSITIENNEDDVDIEIVRNGPEIQYIIEKMLYRRKWRT